jgi:alpha-L-rhamnosidase
VASWFFETICGIQLDPDVPAYKHFFLKPQPGGGLTYAQASYQSIHGEIHSSWKREGSNTHYAFTIPPNTTASVTLRHVDVFPKEAIVENFEKDGSTIRFDLASGSHQFSVKETLAA